MKNNNVFDGLIIDLTQNLTKTYITMDDIYITEGTSVKCIEITMDIFTHLSLRQLTSSEQKKYYTTGYFGNRIDVLLDHVLRLLNGNNEFGIGALTLREKIPMNIIQPNENYYGKRIFLRVYDFS